MTYESSVAARIAPLRDITDTSGTVYDWLRHHAHREPQASAVTVWRQGGVRGRLTFAQMLSLVERIGWALRRRAAVGERALLVLPSDESFPVTLVAAAAVGLIPVPAPTPDLGREVAFRERVHGIATDCTPRLIVTTREWQPTVRMLLAARPDRVLAWEDLRDADDPVFGRPLGDRVARWAYLQYTSGSTSAPKGAAIGRPALVNSCTQAARVYGERTDDVAVTWVPLHHDMGLVTGVLRPLFTGYESVLLEPREFVRDPASWPAAVTATGGTLSSAPNFAYEHAVRRIRATSVAAFDLSSWRVARNAGEVVRPETADRFIAHFADAGLRPQAFCPSYGMAEATLTVAASTPVDPAARLVVHRRALQHGVVAPAGAGGASAGPVTTLSSSGRPVPGTRVRIAAADGQVGDILVRGPQMFSGYWPVSGREADSGPAWHATGDRGFIHDGHLFVLGRADDVVVYHGRKVHPPDVVAACSDFPELRPGRIAVFLSGPGTTAERVCLVAEVGAGRPGPELASGIQRHLASTLDLYVSVVGFLAPGMLPVTTSGKVRVSEVARRFREDNLLTVWCSDKPAHAAGFADDSSTSHLLDCN